LPLLAESNDSTLFYLCELSGLGCLVCVFGFGTSSAKTVILGYETLYVPAFGFVGPKET
jgi:hypothetical protein